jgi:hypothetical protein
MRAMKPTIPESFEAWNRCHLSDEQLDVVISSLRTTIATLMEVEGRGLMAGVMYQMLSSADDMKKERKKEKRK